MTAAVTRGADALVRTQAARLDGFATRLDDLEPDDQLAAHDDALAVLTAALTDPDDPDALARELRRHTFLRSDRFGMEPEGWYCDGCGTLVEPIDSPKTAGEAFAGHQVDALRAAILGGES